jgi:hypothetical protein
MGGILPPPRERPGGGLAGETVVAVSFGLVEGVEGSSTASLSGPNDPNPKSRFCESSASPDSQCPILSTFVGAAGAGFGDDPGGSCGTTGISEGIDPIVVSVTEADD